MSHLKFIYKKIVKKTADTMGYHLVITKHLKNTNDRYQYEFISPQAHYSPWLTDKQFNETYDIIKDYTLVDKYRCYELWQLIEESAKLEGALLEVGVWRGGSGALMAKKMKLSSIKDTMYLCDTFEGVVKAGSRDSSYKGKEHADTSKEIAESLIDTLELDNVKILKGMFPEETEQFVAGAKFRFCHIDVDVYQSAKDVLEWVWPRLVVGGMVVFDDYGFQGCDGVTSFVNEERKKKDRLVVHNLNGHAILVKVV